MTENRQIKLKILLLLLIGVVAFTCALILNRFSLKEKSTFDYKQETIEKVIREKEASMDRLLARTLDDQKYPQPFVSLHPELLPEQLQEKGMTVFLFERDSLIYWSDNIVPDAGVKNLRAGFLKYGNGWYRVMTRDGGNRLAVGLILVKSEYPYQNEYLVNDFMEEFGVAGEMTIDTVPAHLNIRSADGSFLFSLTKTETTAVPANLNLLVFALSTIFFLILVFILFYLYHLFDFLKSRPLILLLAFLVDALLLRLLMLYFEFPAFLYQSDLFSPYYYATSWVSASLGDLVLNSLLALTLAWIFFSENRLSLLNLKRNWQVGVSTLLSLLTGGLFYLLVSTTRKLVIDSNIELNLNNIFNIDIYSGLGFLALVSLSMAFFFFSAAVYCLINKSHVRKMEYILMALFAAILVLFISSGNEPTVVAVTYAGLFFIFALSFLYFSRLINGFKNITGALVYIILFSVIATVALDVNHDLKEKEFRKMLASELVSKRDPLLEFEFARPAGQIGTDSLLKVMVDGFLNGTNDENAIFNYLSSTYLENYWKNFDIRFTLCREDDVLDVRPAGYLENCFSYFNGLMSGDGAEKVSEGLYYMNDRMGNGYYLAEILLPVDGRLQQPSLRLFVEIYYKYVHQTGLGYPDLLIDRRISMVSGIEDYSYAKYAGDALIYKNGDFAYSISVKDYDRGPGKDYFMESDGYHHYVLVTDDRNFLIISKKSTTLLDLIAPFSYLFIMFSIFLILFITVKLLAGGMKPLEFNFSNQLQVSIITIIIISFFVLGIITRTNIIHLYNSKNRDNLSEKTFSVLTELEHKIGNAPALDDDMKEYVNEILFKFSVVFYSDINLFDTSGNLFASSRPQIFNEQLLSGKINPQAFSKLSVERKLLFIQDERIGRQEYLSAYIPFRNNDDRIIAYLNLPYFAKQTELQKEIGDFLAAYINVYVLLIVLAIVITIIVSRFISRPLLLVREKLSGIALGKANEKILLDRKDEIGLLVEEYNRMIDELARSAELLSRSERESAWREMAKQVAHEIKNPLTPMKLSVQYLQKTWDEKSPDFENHLKRFTQTIVEQIDSLAAIASEFSDFAKMPPATIETVSLPSIIKSAAELFMTHPHVSISIVTPDADCFVNADRKQLLRVFNNLIQNAIQAIGKQTDGKIDIRVARKDAVYIVSVTDNGAGISEEQAAKIFSPSFTTKSSGMGLGLAMVKSILTSFNGMISFESKPGEGATFYIEIPAADR